jgi:transcriptional regulator with XRE-family HTH domain
MDGIRYVACMTATEFRAALAALGIPQRQLATRLGVEVSTVNRWALSKIPVPRYAAYALEILELLSEPLEGNAANEAPVAEYVLDLLAANSGRPPLPVCLHCEDNFMTGSEFRAIGQEIYGHRWHEPLAAALGVGARTVQRWANGQNEIPAVVAEHMTTLQTINAYGKAIGVQMKVRLRRESPPDL